MTTHRDPIWDALKEHKQAKFDADRAAFLAQARVRGLSVRVEVRRMTITRDQVQQLWDSITGADKPLRYARAVLQQFGGRGVSRVELTPEQQESLRVRTNVQFIPHHTDTDHMDNSGENE